MGNQARFEGLEVEEIEFEITGGGTHGTGDTVHHGDIVRGTFEAKVVNVKFPFKSGTVVRLQTLNVTRASIDGVLERYEAPPKVEQPELAAEPEGAEVPVDA